MIDHLGKIINAHVHIYPEKIAQRATESVGKFYDLEMRNVGSERALLEEMNACGVRHSFLLSTATVPHQVRAINDFLIDVIKRNGQETFTAFGTVHHLTEDPEGEIDYMRQNGVTGIKFHHDFLGIPADDPAFDRIYEKAQAEGIPVFLHAGDDRYEFTNPKQLHRVYEKFPRMTVIAAHMGGYTMWDEALELLKDTGFYFDTSSSFAFMSAAKAKSIIRKMGAERFFFGTDFPMWKVSSETELLYSLGLKDEEYEKILYRNAENFLSKVKKKLLTGQFKYAII